MNLFRKSFFITIISVYCFCGISFAETSTDFLLKPKVRMDAPTFSLQELNGKETTLNDFSGKIVLLNFWATWCAACREEMPEMEKLWSKLREKGVVIVAVAADKNKKAVREFVKKNGITFPVLYDTDGKTRNQYEVLELPTSYIIGRDGKFTAKIIGTEIWMTEKGQRFLLDEL